MPQSSRLMVPLLVFLALLSVLAAPLDAAPAVAGSSASPSTSSVASRLAHRMRPEADSTPASSLTEQDSKAAQSAMSAYIIDVVNSLPNAGWTAGVNEYFQDKSYAFLKKSCGLKISPALHASSSRQDLEPILIPNDEPVNPYAPVDPASAPEEPTPAPTTPEVSPPEVIPQTDPQPTPADPSQPIPVPSTPSRMAIPAEFDARRQWGGTCASLYDIRDQAGCGSCWAVAAAEVMTDRHCIASGGSNRPYLSAKNILTCCGTQCGSCEGGYPINAFQMWMNEGIVTGGDYGSTSTCQPYFLPPCEHHTVGPLPQCVAQDSTPSCSTSCTSGLAYSEDKHFGASAYQVSSDVEAIQMELMTNGPIEAGFMVYADFPHYQSGVYSHVEGEQVGGHAIKLLGWGTENGRDYWLCANSWNTNWGEQGFFKIARGVNEGMIEQMMFAGVPR